MYERTCCLSLCHVEGLSRHGRLIVSLSGNKKKKPLIIRPPALFELYYIYIRAVFQCVYFCYVRVYRVCIEIIYP